MPPRNPPRTTRRPWTILVGAIVVAFLIVVALAMWSEREDAVVLPEEVERRGEEPWAPEPLDSPAIPDPRAP